MPLSFGLEGTLPSVHYTCCILSIKYVVIMYAWDIIKQHLTGVGRQNVTQNWWEVKQLDYKLKITIWKTERE